MRMREDVRCRVGPLNILFLFMLALLLLAALFPSGVHAQPSYRYGAFHSEITINADGTLLVRDKVTYEFQDPSGWVGLTIPSAYGKVIEGKVLAGNGDPLPDDAWEHEQNVNGYTLWCYTSDAGPSATYIFEYLLSDALNVDGDRVGIEDWGAVPADRDSPIDKSSLALLFPGEVDTSLVELEVTPVAYSGQIIQRYVGNTRAEIEANELGRESYYSVSCFWPSAIMDLEGEGFVPQTGKRWDFERFNVDIQMNEDSSITVRETQVANFYGSFTWLNRDISAKPADFAEGRTYGKVRIHDIAVYDLDGEPYDPGLWNVDTYDYGYDSGKTVQIKFEAQDEQLGWVIEYRMTGATIFAEDYDRLYWNTVSIERDVPIAYSTTTVSLPPGTDMSAVQTTQYIDINSPPKTYDYGRDGDVLWWEVEGIPGYSTFTIDVALPKGVVSKPWQYDSTCGIAVIAASSTLLAGVFIFMFGLWWKRGRDVGRTGTTMVRYEPPESLTPAMVGMLVNQKPRIEDISATIVDLAQRGYLKIFEGEQRSFIRVKKYGFQRLKDDLSGLRDYEREVMNGLFESGEQVTQDDLTNKFYAHNDAILNRGVKKEVLKKKLFIADPSKVRDGYLTIGIILIVLSLVAVFFLPIWFDLGWFVVLLLTLIPLGAVIAVVGWAMPARSRAGSKAYEHVLGFKEYMETAEKPELEYMTPENFQANLPYAMVLGVEEAWAAKFADILTAPPSWYSSSASDYSVSHLSRSLNYMSGSLSRTLASSPSSSGGGGGGGFGGGSSGGGGGGGGSSAG
jgi:uncharacterized membrane protein YgcG